MPAPAPRLPAQDRHQDSTGRLDICWSRSISANSAVSPFAFSRVMTRLIQAAVSALSSPSGTADIPHQHHTTGTNQKPSSRASVVPMQSLMAPCSVHLSVRIVVLVSLGRLLLLPDGDAIAQHPQKLRLELVLVRLATVRRDIREGTRAQRQHVMRRGVLQDRVNRLKPGLERFDFGLGDLSLAVAMVFLKLAITTARCVRRPRPSPRG